jgi:[calcium/calmodulin-dependent protein kinase] kinase
MSHSKFPNHKSTSPANESESDSENSSMFSFCSRLDFSHSFCKDESGFSRSSNRSPTVPVTNTIKKAKSFQGKTKVNQYTLDLLLGRGAFGRVFKGVDDRGQAFAIKVYNKKVLRSKWIGKRKTAMDCVKTEIEVMQTLDHQNIIKLIEVIDMETSKKIYLILELVEGGNLQKKCPMDELSAKSYFKSLLTAIDYLHNKKQIVHRDIKPQNLLISKTNSLKVCDFGAAQFLSDENDELNNSAGTFMFMPPEAHKTGSFRGRPADIWACGITLYYMVIGRSPFEKKSYSALLQEMSENELKIPEKLSDDLKDLIRKMTFLEPEDRIDAESILSHSWLIC